MKNKRRVVLILVMIFILSALFVGCDKKEATDKNTKDLSTFVVQLSDTDSVCIDTKEMSKEEIEKTAQAVEKMGGWDALEEKIREDYKIVEEKGFDDESVDMQALVNEGTIKSMKDAVADVHRGNLKDTFRKTQKKERVLVFNNQRRMAFSPSPELTVKFNEGDVEIVDEGFGSVLDDTHAQFDNIEYKSYLNEGQKLAGITVDYTASIAYPINDDITVTFSRKCHDYMMFSEDEI